MPGLMMAPTPSLAVCVAAFPGQKIPKSELTAEFLTQDPHYTLEPPIADARVRFSN